MAETSKTRSARRRSPRPAPLSARTRSPAPWECRHYADHSEIVAFDGDTGASTTVAVIPQTPGHDAKAIADSLAALVNGSARTETLLRDAADALELVLEDGLTFASEQAADSVVMRMKGKAAL